MENLVMCRICLYADVQHVVKNPQLQETYEKLTTIPTEMRPLVLCYICFAQLKASHRFMLKCLKAEELLAQMLTKDGVLDPLHLPDPTLIDRSAFNRLAHTSILQIFIGGDVQDIDNTEDVLLTHDVCVKSEDQSSPDIPEAANSKFTEADNERSMSNPGVSWAPMNNVYEGRSRTRRKISKKDMPGTAHITDTEDDYEQSLPDPGDVEPLNYIKMKEGRKKLEEKKRQDRLEKASPIAVMKTKLEYESIISTQDVEHDNSATVNFKAEASAPERLEDMNYTLLNKIKIERISLDEYNSVNNDGESSLVGDGCFNISPRIEERFICDACNISFSTKSALVRHTRAQTGAPCYVCDDCGMRFTTKCQLKYHGANTHRGHKCFVCDICKRSFSSKTSLKSHSRTHTGEKPYSCDVCDKSFAQRNTLNRHTRTHTSEKPFECDVCYKCFREKCDLLKHTRTHTGEKPHVCKVCKKRFGETCQLKKHILIHTGEKPYVCDVCDKGFNQYTNLKTHLRIHVRRGERYVCKD